MKIPSLFTVALAVLTIVSLSGCAGSGPKMPVALGSNSPIGNYSTNRFNADYTKYLQLVDGGKLDDARIIRDRMIDSIHVEIDMSYRSFEHDLSGGRATQNTFCDAVELGLSGATAMVGGEATKAVIGAILTGAKGARLSYDKNFFREKTTEVLVTAMQAERSKKLSQIVSNMTALGVKEYPFEDAATDLIAFFYAGTVEGALQNLAVETGQKAQTEKKNLEKAQAERLQIFKAKATEIKLSREIHRRIQDLKQRNSPEAVAEAAAALDKLRADAKARTALNNAPAPTVGDSTAVFSQLQQLENATDQDHTLLDKLADAFGIQP